MLRRRYLALEALVSHFFRSSLDPHLDHRRLIDMAVNETARDLMRPNPVFARENEEVGEVIRRMIGKGVMEIAVVDDHGQVVGDVTMIDLLASL